MKYKIYIVGDHDEFNEVPNQLIATFENVNEDFVHEICMRISEIRDVKCRYEESMQ